MGSLSRRQMWDNMIINAWFTFDYEDPDGIICRRHEYEHLRFNVLCEISRLRLISHKTLKRKCSCLMF